MLAVDVFIFDELQAEPRARHVEDTDPRLRSDRVSHLHDRRVRIEGARWDCHIELQQILIKREGVIEVRDDVAEMVDTDHLGWFACPAGHRTKKQAQSRLRASQQRRHDGYPISFGF